MAAFDFPSSPNVNDIYTLNGVAFMWNGSVWKRYSTSTGAQGFQGATGAAGAQGAQGTNGTIGSDGAQGAQGHQGAAGTGATGAQGAAGAQGATGAAGAQGTPFDRSEYNYTATGGQTAFAAAYANASDVDVFMNGVRLTPAEYTASGGTTITLASGATAGDIIDILTFASAGPTGAQGAQGHQGDAFNRSESNFTATSGQTSFAPSGGYTNGDDLDVFVNGVRLTPADYTATNGTNVVLDVGANTGDIVDIIYYEAAGPAGAQGAAGIAGTVTFSTGAPSNPINGDLWYDTDDGAFAGYYDDGNTSQWIDLSGGPRGAQGADGAQGATGSIPSNITAVNGTFSGNVSIGGTLTYEDVTNIDSVGVVTARAGVHVTGGNLLVGTTNAGGWLTKIQVSDNASYQSAFNITNNVNADLQVEIKSNETRFGPSTSTPLAFKNGGGERLRINSTGYVGINDNNPDTQLSVNSGATNVVAKFASTDQYAWIQFRDNSTTDTAVMVGAEGDNLLLRSGSNERVRVTSGGTVKFATNNSSTDYLEWGGNPRLMLQAPAGLNGLRVYGTTTPLEVGGSASTRKISMGGNPNYDLSISGSYSLSSGGHDSSPKVFLNATRHNGSSTVTSFQTSIQAVSASNTASDGYLGLGASATPDDLVIRPSGNIGINDTAPSEKLNVGGNIMLEGSDQYMYLTNVGTGNAGIYVRGRDATNELRSHSTGIFTWEVTGSEKMRLTSGGEITNGNLVINGFANQNTPGGYSQYQSDNHANTLFGQNLKLGASSGSGNHQIEIINQHATIGGAGMYIGGNGSNQQNQINFYAEAANQSPGTDVTANRRAQIGSSAFFTWVEPRNLNSNGTSYLRTFGFTFNLQEGETETLFYNPDSYRRIWYEIYVQSGHGSNGYGYILANISRYGMQVHDVDWHVSYTSYNFSGSVGGNVSHNGIKFTRNTGYSNTNITYYVIVKAFSPAGGTPYSNSGLTDPSYRYFSQGY